MNLKCRARRPRSTLALPAIAAALAAATAPTAAATGTPPSDATFAAIRSAELTLARIGFRLAVANALLCDRLEPGLGLLLHTPAQYTGTARAAARRFFRLDGPVGVEGVVAGSPAAAAGLTDDDVLLAVGTARFAPDDPVAPATTAALAEAWARIAALPPDKPFALFGRRGVVARAWTVAPVPACRTRFELRIGRGFPADADGTLVRIGSRFLADYPEDHAAAVVAHELAHNILHHRTRLEAQGVAFGAEAGFGRSVAFVRRTELEADILSVSLLANAGYDPAATLRFWKAFGPTQAGGALRARTHPSWSDRVAVLARAIAEIGPARFARPTILLTRDRPLDDDWRALLP